LEGKHTRRLTIVDRHHVRVHTTRTNWAKHQQIFRRTGSPSPQPPPTSCNRILATTSGANGSLGKVQAAGAGRQWLVWRRLQGRSQGDRRGCCHQGGTTPAESRTPAANEQIDLESGDDDIAEIQQEITVLSGCDSAHITKYYGRILSWSARI